MAETVIVLVVLVVYFASLVALFAVAKLNPNRFTFVRAKSSTPLVFPPRCVITGESATEEHLIRQYRLIYPVVLQSRALSLPFSSSGWEEYRKQFPRSLAMFKTGLGILRWIPGLGPYIALYVWAPLVGAVCGVFAFRDLWLRRFQLVSVETVYAKRDGLREVDMRVVSGTFVEEFMKLNPNGQYEIKNCDKHGWNEVIRRYP
jgi:hypothetical protein